MSFELTRKESHCECVLQPRNGYMGISNFQTSESIYRIHSRLDILISGLQL